MFLKETDVDTRNWVDMAQGRDYWRAPVNVALSLRISLAMELVNNIT